MSRPDSRGLTPPGDGCLSDLTLDRALKHFMAATGEPLTAVWQTVTLNPARAVGLGDRKGTIETGKDADLVLLDDACDVALTVVGGRIVYSAL